MFFIRAGAAACALLFAALPAMAATQNFTALPTLSDHNGRTINLWFDRPLVAGWDLSYVLTAPGQFWINPDETGGLTGSAHSLSDSSTGFRFDFRFDKDFVVPPVFKSLFGAVEPANSFFMDLEYGRLSGFGDLKGLELDVTRYPDPGGAATQIGGGLTSEIASNLHNANFGLSSWFTITDIVEDACIVCTSPGIQTLVGAQGDVVFDLVPAPVPLPASGIMLLLAAAGLGGVGALRRWA